MRNEMDESDNRHGRFYQRMVVLSDDGRNMLRSTSSLVVINAGVNTGEGLRKRWLISSDTTHSRYVLTCVASIITHNLGYVDFLGFSGK